MHPALKGVWSLIPKPIQDAIAVTIDRVQGNVDPEPAFADSSKPVRLFICPANYAGQGFRWSRAVEANPEISARNMVYAEINPFGYEADFPVRWRTVTHSRKWQRAQLNALTKVFTHVLIEAEFPPLGGMFRENVLRQVQELRKRGTHVAMVCHGSDIRLPSRHKELEQWSPFANDDWVPVARLEKFMLKNRALLDAIDAPTFVSTPGLLLDVPFAHLLPVVISPEKWISSSPPLERQRPRVVHIPSNPLVKGTAEISAAMQKLDDEKLIEYVQVTGKGHDEMPGIYAGCDIVLDQFRLGDYGVAACEAMAAGRVVVSHVSEQARGAIKALSGLDLPIVEANIDNIENVLRGILRNRQSFRDLARQGPEFVRVVHDGEFSRRILEAQFLMVDRPATSGDTR